MAWKGAKKVGVALRIMHVWYIGTSVFIHVSYFAYNDIRYMINTILYIYILVPCIYLILCIIVCLVIFAYICGSSQSKQIILYIYICGGDLYV